MATIGNLALNFNDLRKRQAPDGTIDHIIEVLAQTDPILEHIKWKQGNLPTGNLTTQRTSLPSPSLRAINKGVQPTKSTTKQVTDTCCILEDRSQVDIELLQLEPDPQAFRRSEDDAHVAGFANRVANMIFYGDSDANLDEFNGLSKRYNAYGGTKGDASYQVRDAGGTTDGQLSSIWFVGWGDTVSGIYPKFGYAGLKQRDLGERTVLDDEKGEYQALETLFTYKPGLMVADPRMVAAVRNIDTAAILNATSAKSWNLCRTLCMRRTPSAVSMAETSTSKSMFPKKSMTSLKSTSWTRPTSMSPAKPWLTAWTLSASSVSLYSRKTHFWIRKTIFLKPKEEHHDFR